MKRLLIVLVLLAATVTAAVLSLPLVAEAKLRWDCPGANPNEMCILRMRRMGDALSRNGKLEAAGIWYHRAANAGDAYAMFHLGWVHERLAGRDFSRPDAPDGQPYRITTYLHHRMEADKEAKPDNSIDRGVMDQAIGWYRKASEEGFAPAMNNLAQIYLDPRTGFQDFQKASHWHLAAARRNHPFARWNLAVAAAGDYGSNPSICSTDQWAGWEPQPNWAEHFVEPVLERTVLMGTTLNRDERSFLRETAEVGRFIHISPQPYVDIGQSTFTEVDEELRRVRGDDVLCWSGHPVVIPR